MSRRLRIKIDQPWIAYPGSTLQQNYAEQRDHGYLLWDIKDRDHFNVKFHELPNPKPFVTIDWMGSVRETLEIARDYPDQSRFRIKHRDHISHKDSVLLTQLLKQELNVSEVTFKGDQQKTHEYFNTGDSIVKRDDLRSPEVLLRLLKEFYQDAVFSDEEWSQAHEQIKGYLSNINDESSLRNVSWSIKHLKFDNLFCYGEGNQINFQNLNGIVGIFGPNRSGKSSIPGTLMYSLFNATDRGSIKNLHVVNARKPYCYSRIVLGINGIDYAIERQTVKNESRHGDVHASTSLNFFRVNDGTDLTDLAGEQRTDTDKTIRQHIGTADDIALTSISAQGEINQVIELGSTKRNQMLSRFLDLDIFYKLYQQASSDVNTVKTALKQFPDQDWHRLAIDKQKTISDCDVRIAELNLLLASAHERLSELRNESYKHRDIVPVTKFQVTQQRERIQTLVKQVESMNVELEEGNQKIQKDQAKLDMIESLRNEYDLSELRKRQDALRKLEASFVTLKHNHSREASLLRQQKRAVKILKKVPCGDQYPNCSFINDTHQIKEGLDEQTKKVEAAATTLAQVESSLNELKSEDIIGKISKLEELNSRHSQLTARVSELQIKRVKLETMLRSSIETLASLRARMIELEVAFENDENVEVVAVRHEIDSLQVKIAEYDREKLDLATKRGREALSVETLATDRRRRHGLMQKLKIHEMVAVAFSKKGIPNVILTDRLPAINAEIGKILAGIVDFTVELERDAETDQLEIFLNYGDSRRLVELGSGMEKSLSSIAIRVALINISSLPKSDFFVIDEGFGVFDDAGVEACNRLLLSLKRYFRLIVVITHVDAVKDIADHVLEITKAEKDSKVLFE